MCAPNRKRTKPLRSGVDSRQSKSGFSVSCLLGTNQESGVGQAKEETETLKKTPQVDIVDLSTRVHQLVHTSAWSPRADPQRLNLQQC